MSAYICITFLGLTLFLMTYLLHGLNKRCALMSDRLYYLQIEQLKHHDKIDSMTYELNLIKKHQELKNEIIS